MGAAGYGIGAGISGIGSLVGGAMGASAADSAAEKQASAADRASKLQYQMYQQQRSDLQPWRQSGISALYGTGGIFKRKDGGSGIATDPAELAQRKQAFMNDQLSSISKLRENINNVPEIARAGVQSQIDAKTAQAENDWNAQNNQAGVATDQYEIDPELTKSFSNADFVKDPGYDFRMQEGQKALERSAAARGGLQSGGAMKELAQYGQDYASNEYNNAYNRFNNDRSNRFNRLSSLAGGGQAANNQIGAAAQSYASNAGQNMMGAANAQGAAGIAGANAWGSAISGVANAGMNAYAANNQQNWMDKNVNGQKANLSQFATPMAGQPIKDYRNIS